jgi:hypothetical protein
MRLLLVVRAAISKNLSPGRKLLLTALRLPR